MRLKVVMLLGVSAAMAVAVPGKQGAELLVIAADQFVSTGALQPLLDWKMKKGVSDTLVPLSDIGSDPDSLPDKIKDFIVGACTTWDLKPHYVLLVGSLDPYSPFYIPPYVNGEGDEQFDCGYGDVVNEHGEVDDSLMEISIGRFPANTVDEVRTMAMKTVVYERRADRTNPFWTATGTTIVNEDGHPDDTIYWNDSNILHAYWRLFGYARSDSFSRLLGHNSDSVTQAGNAGRAFVTYRGQAVGCWDGPFDEIAPEEWANGGMLPIVVGATCLTMDYDDGWGMYGDRFVKAGGPSQPRGAVAYFGTALTGDIIFRSAVYRGLFSAIYERCSLKLGPATLSARVAVIPLLEDSEDLDPYYEWNLFGDPSLHMWVGGDTPVTANIEGLPTQIEAGESYTLQLRVAGAVSNNQIAGARVCAWKPGEVFATGVTDWNGFVNLVVLPLTEGPLYVTASEGREYQYEDERLDWPPIVPVETLVSCVVPPAPPWTERAPMPLTASNKAVKDGGWLAHDGNEFVYAAKGNNTPDFYRYLIQADSWVVLKPTPLPVGSKNPAKGCRGVCDIDGHVYMTKGHNKSEFWCYHVAGDSWSQLPDVPLGVNGKKVKGGTDMAYALVRDTGYVYLLKGYKNEFYRFNTVSGDSGRWETLPEVPPGHVPGTRWREGSWLVYDGDHTMYAHRSYYHELYRYDMEVGSWSNASQGMPLVGRSGRSEKSKDGGSAAWFGGAILALKGGNTQETWRFDPTDSTWSELDTLPSYGSTGTRKCVSKGADMVACSGGGELLALKGNKCNEFWRYLPSQADRGEAVVRYASGGGTGRDNSETPVLDGIEAYSPRWKSDGSAIVVSAEDSMGWMQLWELAYSGGIGSVSRLSQVAMDCEQPVYNPAGTEIAFTLDDTATGFLQIAVVSSGDGGGGAFDGEGSDESDGSTSATNAPTPTYAKPGVACPSQKAVAGGSAGARPDRVGLSTARRIPGATPASGEITVITSDSYDHYDPAWSPDNEDPYIVYTKDGDDGRSHIWRIPAGGGEEEQLTFGNSSEEVEPSYLNGNEVVFTLIPDDPSECDQIAKVNVGTHDVTVLTSSETDHEAADAAGNGSAVVCQALDANGNSQIVKVLANGGQETFLTAGGQGSPDMEEPDWSPDNHSVFCVRWTGITSAICRVDADYGGWTPVTDSSAIRDNPDAWYDMSGNTSYIIYERQAWDEQSLMGFGGRQKRGTGIFKSHYRRPHDGEMGASLGVLALDRIEPNPASSKSRVTILWQIPAISKASLKVFNAAGQLVRVLAQGEVKPGRYTTTWAGTDQKGRRLAAGIYFCALDTGDKRLTRKVVLAE
jgi:Tol biopolymer transport system component/N-acetylneuraminic acid mutarotase